jgi:hypothetical protein
MKYLSVILFFFTLALPAMAQDDEPAMDKDPKTRARIDAARAAYITDRLGLTTEEAERFWPVRGAGSRRGSPRARVRIFHR